MDITLFWAIFAVLGISYFAVAVGATTGITSEEDFFYTKGRLNFTSVAFSLVAIHVGGGLVLASAEEAYLFGLGGLCYGLGIFFGFLGLFFYAAPRFNELGIKTIAELFSLKYKSLLLRRIASMMSIITLGGLLVGQIIASRKLLSSLGEQYDWLLVVFWLMLICYTFFGGLRAVIATEIFQVTLVLMVFLVATIFYWYENPNAFAFVHDLDLFAWQGQAINEGYYKKCFLLFFMPLAYAFLAQDLGQRFFALSTPSMAAKSALMAGLIVLFFSVVPVLLGMEAKFVGIKLDPKGSVILQLFAGYFKPFFYYLLICAIIAALSSTADALLCAISSNLVEDFFLAQNKHFINHTLVLPLSRAVVLFLGSIALGLGYLLDDIFQILSLSYQLSVSCLLVPVLFSLIIKKPKWQAASLSVVMGVAGFLAGRFVTDFIFSDVLGLVFSSFGFFCGQMFARPIQNIDS